MSDDFNPWTASIEEAMAAQEEWLAADKHREHAPSPLTLYQAAERITELKESVLNGDEDIEGRRGRDVLEAVGFFLKNRLIVPEWLALEYKRRLDAVTDLRVRSWDDYKAFGKPFPKGKQLPGLRRGREEQAKVTWAMWLVKDIRRTKPFDRDCMTRDEREDLIAGYVGVGVSLGGLNEKTVRDWCKEPPPIDDSLFEKIGEDFGIHADTVEKRYRSLKKKRTQKNKHR